LSGLGGQKRTFWSGLATPSGTEMEAFPCFSKGAKKKSGTSRGKTFCFMDFKGKDTHLGGFLYDFRLKKSHFSATILLRFHLRSVIAGGWRSPKDQQGLHRWSPARVGGHHH